MYFLSYLPSAFWIVGVAAQVACAVHAVRSGRTSWLWLILLFSWIGCLVYFVAEVLPGLRARRNRMDGTRPLADRLNPAAALRRLEDQVAHSNSVTNRMELARAYVRAGRREDAIALYRSCMQGVHGEDPRVLSELGKALYEGGYLPEAADALDRLRAQRPLAKDEQLVRARILEDSGDTEAALSEYAPLARGSAGEEARLRYALLLRKLGHHTEAKAVLEEILRHARMSPAFYRHEQKEWIGLAKKELKELGSGRTPAAR
jgi:hypothetical protein